MVIPLSVESAIHYHATGMATKLGMATNRPEARCEGAAGFQPLLKLQNPLKLLKLLKLLKRRN